jgi:hypothetical protein
MPLLSGNANLIQMEISFGRDGLFSLKSALGLLWEVKQLGLSFKTSLLSDFQI